MKHSSLTSLDLRKKFFDYFIKLDHEKVASSSLIPVQDPTILFTNAGMNQFKDVFLGNEKRNYKRAVSIQKCVRAGGKHNDLENVGFTARHLTFFEMMGNFSFGDYFKKEAITYAWNFLTQDLKMDTEHLFVSVHISDQESYDIWHKQIGIPKEKIFRLDESNFWQMGDVGPCGPCTEIFVDRGSKYGCGKKDCTLACGCDRFLEVWNNVFMQFNRQPDGTDVALKQTGVDTGMGLERLTAIIQNKDSVFETDLFAKIFAKIEQLTGLSYQKSNKDIQAAFNVIGDHVRSATFLIADGCAPSNDGRGYVLRKIIRRAALFAQKIAADAVTSDSNLGPKPKKHSNIFPQVAITLIEDMQTIYPELGQAKDRVIAVLESEIERFADNLVRGKKILQEYIGKQANKKIVDGAQAFMLYDTYGFPLEVTKLIAQESGFVVDEVEFEKQMEQQRQRSGKKMKNAAQTANILENIATKFTGYESLQEQSKIIALVVNDQSVSEVNKNTTCWIVADKTPFYVACGGQVNDQGFIFIKDKKLKLLDLKKQGNAILMQVVTESDIAIGDRVEMKVDEFARLQTMKNHTATHLLQAALQQLFGKGVKQAGSVVTPEYLRFDFTHHTSLTAEEIKSVENLVNQKIWDNIPVHIQHTTFKKAVADGVIAFFGEKYDQENVRAIIIDKFSAELCGGTHVRATGDIGVFKITEETSLAAGTRRIVALTGFKAVQEFQQDFSIVKKLCQDFKIKPDMIVSSVQDLQNKIKENEKENKQLKISMITQNVPEWISKIENLKSMSWLFLQLKDYGLEELREIAQILQKQKPGFYFIVSIGQSKICFVAGVGQQFITTVHLNDLKSLLQNSFGLQGGGSSTLIQGSGTNIDTNKLRLAIQAWLQAKL